MIPVVIFILSYIFYLYTYLQEGIKIIYPVYLFLPVVIIIFFIFCFLLKKISNETIKEIIFYLLNSFYACSLLFFTKIFIKINIPSPHNFLLRKFELILGASYILFIFFLIFLIIKKGILIELQKKDINFIFKYITLFFFITYFFISLWFNYANQPVGDEPEYLLIAHSLIYDRDIDLKNNFLNQDYKNFYLHKRLTPQTEEKKGKIISYHPAFVGLLYVPGYLLFKRIGATITSNLFMALSIGIFFLILYNIFNNVKISLYVSFFTGFSVPYLTFANQICPDVPMIFFVLLIIYLILFKDKNIYLISILTGILLFLQVRSIAIVLSVYLIYFLRNYKDINKIIKFFSTQILFLSTFFIYNYFIYNTLIPQQTKNMESIIKTFSFNIKGLIGLFMDQEFGIFFYVPVLIFVFSGFILFYKENKKQAINFLILFLPYYFLIASWIDWRGGGGAYPRLLLPVSFILFIFFASVLKKIIEEKEKTKNIILKFLLSISVILSIVMSLIPWFRWNKGYGENEILKITSEFIHINITKIFPSLWHFSKQTYSMAWVWIVIIFILNIYILKKKNAR